MDVEDGVAGAVRRRAPRRAGRPSGPRRVAGALALAAGIVAVGAVSAAPGAEGATSPRAPRVVSPRVAASRVVVSPAPGSRTASPQTEISLLGVPARDIGAVKVTGSLSGPHRGRLEAYSTGSGASFVVARPFVAGETVTVRTHLDVAGAPGGSWRFVVAHDISTISAPTQPALRTDVPGVLHPASAPELAAPVVTVQRDDAPEGGDFFLAPKGTTGRAGPMIVRADGRLVWFHPLASGEAFDLNVQRYQGKDVLTWFQGEVVDGHGQGEDVIESSSYHTVAVVHAGNGLDADLHELQLTPQGTLWLTAYQGTRWNLSGQGGPVDGDALDGIVQEVDVATGLVMYQWDSLDHVPVSQSDFRAPHAPDVPYDYFHVNSIDVLPSGDLLVSARNTSAAYEIDPARSGKVVWTLGGSASSFTMGPGARFWFQHDVREVAPNLLTIFDDGAAPAREAESRALVERIDPADRTATLVRAYLPPGGLLAGALGSVETLPGGDVVVGWGTAPVFTEYSRAGSLLYEASLPAGDDSYREYRDPWSATPTTRPAVVLSGSGASTVVNVSWNGATAVRSWRVLGGSTRRSLTTRAVAPDVEFSTSIADPRPGAVVAVEAIGRTGAVLARSGLVRG